MGQTRQGSFDTFYHHIEAPTIQDEEYGIQFKRRKLVVPKEGQDEAYRSPLLAYLAESPWAYARKVDGENIRIQWDGEQALWNGKSNAFQCSAEFTEYMNNTFIEEIFEEKFGRDKVVTLFGEKMGPKTQGNELGLEKDEVVLYDVNVNGTWLSDVNVVEVANYFGFGVPSIYRYMPHGQAPTKLRELIEMCANGEFRDWEGIVATPLVEIRDQGGHRVIVKIKNKDYLRDEAPDKMQVVGHTPVNKIRFVDNVLSTDVFSTDKTGFKLGEGKFAIVDTEKETWEYAKEDDGRD